MNRGYITIVPYLVAIAWMLGDFDSYAYGFFIAIMLDLYTDMSMAHGSYR